MLITKHSKAKSSDELDFYADEGRIGYRNIEIGINLHGFHKAEQQDIKYTRVFSEQKETYRSKTHLEIARRLDFESFPEPGHAGERNTRELDLQSDGLALVHANRLQTFGENGRLLPLEKNQLLAFTLRLQDVHLRQLQLRFGALDMNLE